MQYNLLRNGSLQAVTSSGAGNVNLTWVELETLFDQVTDQGGVTLDPSETLVLDGDLTQRIKVDGINLYFTATSGSVTTNDVLFYYKNETAGSYTLRPTLSGVGYFYTTIPSPSAPRYIRCTISGVAVQIHEFQIFNDDYIVAFGTDGLLTAEYLGDTPAGSESAVNSIAIYNKGTSSIPANAYTCVEPQGNPEDWYLEISASQSGPFLSFEDGAFIEDDDVLSTWRWSDGTLNGLAISGDSLVRGVGGAIGEIASTIPFVAEYDKHSLCTGDNTMAWDRVNKKMYIMGRDAIYTAAGPLKLWEYLYETDTWSYECTIDYTNNNSMYHWPVMAYCNVSGSRRIYVSPRLDDPANIIEFGYHVLDGAANNWTSITSIDAVADAGLAGTDYYDAMGMCSDGERFIYVNWASRNGTNNSYRFFARFDTISGTWTYLDEGYNTFTHGSEYHTFSCLTYDNDNDRIYALCSAHGQFISSSYRYIQMYDVATDNWTPQYLSWNDITRFSEYVYAGINYCDGYIYMSPNYGWDEGNIYRWKLPLLEKETLPFGLNHYYPEPQAYSHTIGFPIQAINPADSEDHLIYVCSVGPGFGEPENQYLYKMNALAGSRYTSPIFKLTSNMNSSFWVVQGTTESGTSSISYDPNVYNGSIRVRSSDTVPLTDERVYMPYDRVYGLGVSVLRWVPYTDDYNIDFAGGNNYHYNPQGFAVDRRSGDFILAGNIDNSTSYLQKFNKEGSQIYYLAYAWGTGFNFEDDCGIDKDGGIWGYNHGVSSNATYSYNIWHIDEDLNFVYYNYGDTSDFIHSLTVEMDGTGCWYTTNNYGTLVHVDYLGNTLHTIVLPDPGKLCGTLDNGCWVAENTDNKLFRYDSSGNLQASISLGHSAERLTTDYTNGCWYLNGDNVYHVNQAGVRDIGPILIDQSDNIKGAHDGVYVLSMGPNKMRFIDKSTGTITKLLDFTGLSYQYLVDYFNVWSFNYDDYAEFKETTYLPNSYDPVWDDSAGSLEWTEVVKDGYFLPKVQCHQVEITLRGEGGSIDKLIMAPAVNTQDIPSDGYKNVYVKAVIPLGASIQNYNTKLRTWWGLED